MYKLCKTEQSAARQRELEEGLLRAMEDQRYEDISISDLCQQMGIPRKSFYRYFSGKDGALYALLDHTLLEYERLSLNEEDRKTEGINILEQFFYFWYQRKPLLDALESSGLSGVLTERAVHHAVAESAVPAHYLSAVTKDMRRHAITFVVTGLMSIMVSWHNSGYDRPYQEMAQLAGKMLTQPLISI